MSCGSSGTTYTNAGAWWHFTTVVDPLPVALSGAVASSEHWPVSRLVDGDPGTVYTSRGHDEHLSSTEWVAVRLPTLTTVDRLQVYPRANPSVPGATLGFPKDFVVQYAWDGGGHTCDPADPRFDDIPNWAPLLSYYGFAQPLSGPVTFAFTSRAMGCLRLLAAELSQDDYGVRYLQFSEVQLYTGSSELALAGAVASSEHWPVSRLVDSNLGTVYTSRGHDEHLSSAEWVAVRLPVRTTVDRLLVHPRANPSVPGATLGFPKDFVVQYAWDGDGHTCDPADPRFAEIPNWAPLLSYYGFSQPPSGPVTFTFTSRAMGCLRLLAAELSQDDYGVRYLQFSEVQLFMPAPSTSFIRQPGP